MKFVLVEKHLYWWPVTVRVPDPDQPGKFAEQELQVQFEARRQEEAVALQEAYARLSTPRERAEAEIAELRAICQGWDGVVDGNGNPVPFSEETFARALDQSWFRAGVWTAYHQSVFGIEAGSVGN